MGAVTLIMLVVGSQPAPESTDLRCGSHCLYITLKALDFPVVSFKQLEEKLGQPTPVGYSLAQLDEVARAFGAHTLGVRTTCDNLLRRPGRFACIALVDNAHFVNVANIEEGRVYIVDAPKDYWLPIDTFRARWSGEALLISTAPLAREEDLPKAISPSLIVSIASIVGVLLLIVAIGLIRGRKPAAA